MPAFHRLALILVLLGAPLAATPVWAQNKPPAKPAPITDAKGWRAALLQRVRAATLYPQLPQPPVKEGEAPPPLPSVQVTVVFALDREGRLLSAKVVQGSGRGEFDQAALDALKRATPFPKLTTDITGETVTLRLPIHFVGGAQTPVEAAGKKPGAQ